MRINTMPQLWLSFAMFDFVFINIRFFDYFAFFSRSVASLLRLASFLYCSFEMNRTCKHNNNKSNGRMILNCVCVLRGWSETKTKGEYANRARRSKKNEGGGEGGEAGKIKIPAVYYSRTTPSLSLKLRSYDYVYLFIQCMILIANQFCTH